MLNNLKSDLNKLKNPVQAKNLQWFFKTGPGEYGQGDIFLGLKMGQTRQLVKKYFKDINFSDTQKLLNSKIHEYRMAGVLILVEKYKKGDDKLKKEIYNFYLKNTKNINNWDLVDLSAPNIVGDYLLDRDRKILYRLVKSKNLWERRIAVLATAAFINQKDFRDILKISRMLLNDKPRTFGSPIPTKSGQKSKSDQKVRGEHDLIHKAVGWMLREVGKRDEKVLLKFLDKYTLKMPRTMLRYAIERLSEKKRKYYLTKR